MRLYKIATVFFLFSIVDAVHQRKLSKSTSKKVLEHLGTRTPYRINANSDLSIDDNSACARKIWMVIGHGSAYPGKRIINEMQEFLPPIKMAILKGFANGKSTLTYEAMDEIDRWRPIVRDVKYASVSAKAGRADITSLAKRMQARYPHLFPKKFTRAKYLLKFVNENKISQTTRAFAIGLFGPDAAKQAYFPKLRERDIPIIRPHKHCKKWLNEVRSNDKVLDDTAEFFDSKYVKQAEDNINNALGTNFTVDDLDLMYIACGYETAWREDGSSPWCSIFNEKDIAAFEYIDDILQYWYHGYAFDLTSKQASSAIRDATMFFLNRKTKRTTRLYFTDNTSVVHLLSNLGLYKSDSLTSKNYKVNANRNWRSSRIGGFGTNLALIYYSCEETEPYVSVLHNERLIKLPACPTNIYCNFSTFRKHYKSSINDDDFYDVCED